MSEDDLGLLILLPLLTSTRIKVCCHTLPGAGDGAQCLVLASQSLYQLVFPDPHHAWLWTSALSYSTPTLGPPAGRSSPWRDLSCIWSKNVLSPSLWVCSRREGLQMGYWAGKWMCGSPVSGRFRRDDSSAPEWAEASKAREGANMA